MLKSFSFALCASMALAYVGGPAAQNKPAPPPSRSGPLGEPIEQDFAWLPFAERPPFRGPLVEDEDTRDVIWAGNAVFTAGDPPSVPAELQKPLTISGAFAPGWFLVHFSGDVRPEDRADLDLLTGPVRRADGTPLVRWYVPNDTLAVFVGSERTLRALESLERVDWVGRYQPAYKLDPTIGTTRLTSPERLTGTYVLNVDLMPGASLEGVATDLAALGIPVVERVDIRGDRGYDVRFLVVEAAALQVPMVALVEGVRTVQEAGDGLARYDLSGGGKLQARTLTVDDKANLPVVDAARFPLWITHDLQGQGQLIGVVDSNFDVNNTGLSGCGFGFPDTAIQSWGWALPNLARVLLPSVGSGGVSLKVPRADALGGAALGAAAGDVHGSGVAGAAAADFYGDNDGKWWQHDVDDWESWAPTNYSGLIGPGIAHEAQLYLTPVNNTAGAFRWEFAGEFETNMSTTLSNMSAAGVCSTNHSVGLAEAMNTYTQTSVAHDTRGYDRPMMLQCMAAGNSGAGTNRLTSQAVVKNALTVGASDDVLRPENRVAFSSTGPTFDGRIKPDVMAPGDDTFPRAGGVASLLMLPSSNGSTNGSCVYQFTSGTSFASPTMAGAAALVHQYFQEGRYGGTPAITDPSSALMKAMLVNAGHRLTGSNLGDNLYPNMYQGWGEPSLVDVLDLPGTARRLVAKDVAPAGGFTSSASTPQSYVVNVNGSAERLRVTLAWTDEPGSTGTGKKLVNDLDLIVTAPGGAVYRGNVINGTTGLSVTGGSADTLNNVENVIVASPAFGAWNVTVDPGPGNYASGQGYALVVTGDVSEGGGGPAAPVANFVGSPTSGTAPLLVAFTDQSTGTIDTWAWSFGDGGVSSAPSPSHTYTSPGSYTVTLTVTGPGGTDPETKAGYVTVSAPSSGARTYLSFTTAATIPGVGTVQDEDVVWYDAGTGTWGMYFDGSDVGLTADVDALHLLANGDLVLSVDADNVSVPGLTGGPSGTTINDEDLVIFAFTSSGSTTAGSFSFVFDGSDVGLTTANEDIDGIYEFPGGGLAVSTRGDGSVTGVSFTDEDVLLFSATQYGSATSGTWSLYFDGSDVGFNTSSNEDIDAVSFDGGIDMLFSTISTWSAAGGAGEGEDVGRFTGTFGSATSGSASLALDLSALGIDASEDVDGIHYQP